jgi:hypothetical protein
LLFACDLPASLDLEFQGFSADNVNHIAQGVSPGYVCRASQ